MDNKVGMLTALLSTVIMISFAYGEVRGGSEQSHHMTGEEFHVCPSSAGSNNGSSWSNCWAWSDVFGSATRWKNSKTRGYIGPGDIVYLDGGSSGITYTERLETHGNGTPGNPIAFKPGSASPSSSGHDGRVTITASGIDFGIYLQGNSYITIDGQKGSSSNIRVTGCRSNGIETGGRGHHQVIRYIEIDNNGSNGASTNNGIRFNFDSGNTHTPKLDVSYCEIHDNYQDGIHGWAGDYAAYGQVTFHRNTLYNTYDDGMETGGMGVDMHDNTVFGIRSVPAKGIGHPDGLVCMGSYCRIWNNTVYNFTSPDDARMGNSAIYYNFFTITANTDACCVRIFNNLIYNYNAPVSGNYLRGMEITFQKNGAGSYRNVSDILIANNTIVGFPVHGFGLFLPNVSGTVSNITIVNNILHSNGRQPGSVASILFDDGTTSLGSWGSGKGVVFDYNINYAGLGVNGVNYMYTRYSWNGWKALNSSPFYLPNAHGSTAAGRKTDATDPELDAVYRPRKTSTTVIDKGVDLSSFTNMPAGWPFDKNGTARPQGSGWDIGAYEYTSPGP